ncbi:MAG: hypothetical protein ACLFUB_13250 [Cyclobacteriaceae bacterium]
MQQSDRHKVRILPELEELIPPLKEEEFRQLEENILREGCREALLVWPRNDNELLLIDGHNRLKICRKHQLKFQLAEKHFDSLEDAKDFMIINQLGRRNLNPQQASYLRGLRLQREKKEKGRYDRTVVGKHTQEGKTAARLAEEYKLSQATLERDGSFARGLDAIGRSNLALKKQILAGTLRLKKGMIRKAAKLKNLPKVNSADELIAVLEGKCLISKEKAADKEAVMRQREEARCTLLELCEVMQDSPYLSETLASNILAAAKQLHQTFQK